MRQHCDQGGSIFFSTHVLEVAEKLCDKVAIIKNGRLVVSGTMEEVQGQHLFGGCVPGTGGRTCLNRCCGSASPLWPAGSWAPPGPKEKASTTKAIGYGLLFLYVFGVFGALFFLTFGSLGDAYHTLGLDWLYFALFAVADLALMFIFSVFTAKSQLFEAKDNELLLSMPIPPRQILTSRLVMLPWHQLSL